MFPLWDDVPGERIPYVNYAIIAACVLAFLVQLGTADEEALVRQLGMIPIRVTDPQRQVVTLEGRDSRGEWVREEINLQSPVPAWMTILTSMFLHGGWLHLIGNMWFLYIFGDNVEDRFGHLGYLVMYLLCGLAAAVLHIASAPSSALPTVGASGAIAGVMGSYLLLYPRARVMALVLLGLFTRIVAVPAVFFLGFWFLMQVFSGLADQPGMGGVAWWAHVGGFVTGLGSTWLMRDAGLLRPAPSPPLVHGFPQSKQERNRWA